MSDFWYVLAFYVISIALIGSALMVVTRTNIVHSALFLVVAFASMAGIFILLNAEFVAAVQLLVYVGAIAVLLLFAIMLTQKAYMSQSNPANRQAGWAGLVALALLVTAVLVFVNTPWKTGADITKLDTTNVLGQLLFNGYVLPFEIASVLLLVAVVGSIVLARED
ncbi:MAG: NADH-quinone oxidoreductase subunit J [Bacteroidetes bacterium]|nr:NADH-quinone oxidoreductase subunit J [Bacteroidota bacterium]